MTRTPEQIAREIAGKAIDLRVCCKAQPECQTEAWRVWLASAIALALTQVEKETIERCAAGLRAAADANRDSGDWWRDRDGETSARFLSRSAALREAEATIRSLSPSREETTHD